MSKRRKHRTALPRLTVMAWDRRQLAAFLDSVEKLSYLTVELANQLDRVKAISPRSRGRKTSGVDGTRDNGAAGGRGEA